MTRLSLSIAAAALLAAVAPAVASDLPADAAAKKPAAPAPAPTTTTLGLEVSPEFFADPSKSTYGTLNDAYFKGTLTETVAPGWTIAGVLQLVDKLSNTPATYQALLEVNAGYKAKLSDNFSVTVTGGLGYTFGNTGYSGGAPVGAGTDPYFYWYGTAALDDKIDSHWTWNMLNVRVRNAFTVAWYTPKLQTGITYNIDGTHAVYANIGYSWKDNGSGLKPDKVNVAMGYKVSF